MSYLTSEDLHAFNVESRERGILAYVEVLLLFSASLSARTGPFRLFNKSTGRCAPPLRHAHLYVYVCHFVRLMMYRD